MIPKIIHYCWLSDNPVPKSMQRYISTWKRIMPNYEFIKWDFGRFDKNSSIWVKEAFDNKKYAFAADYIRLYALYNYGGIYLDMDVQVLKPFDDLLHLDYFVCYENHDNAKVPEVAAFGATKNCWWFECLLKYYENRHFILNENEFDMKPLPKVVRDVLKSNGISFCDIKTPNEAGNPNEVSVLPYDYFSPKSYFTGVLDITSRTYSIHQFAGSWLTPRQRIEKSFFRFLGVRMTNALVSIKHLLKSKVSQVMAHLHNLT